MERRCRFVLSHRLCSCLVVIARPSWGGCVVVLSIDRPELAAPRKTKAREAGAARAFGSHEIVEDQDVTATSATRPKSRVATRASVQQQGVASCIRTAMGYARPGGERQEAPGSEAVLYTPLT